MYDPWQNCKTRNNYNADEVISALQKSIRRSNEIDACKFAYELYLTSEELEEKLWKRLLVISVEDVGLGNPNASVIVNNLYQMRKAFNYQDIDRPLFFVHAVRVLCNSKKDRSSDLLKNIVEKEFNKGILPEIPDYALDMHTRRGQEMGRDINHFINVASTTTPNLEVDNDYKEEFLKLLEEELRKSK